MSTAETMRGILINPYTKSITETMIDGDDVESLRKALFWVGDPPVEAVGVAATFPNGDNIIVTEGGSRSFRIGDNEINGMAVVLGSDKEAREWQSAAFGLEDMQNYVRFS